MIDPRDARAVLARRRLERDRLNAARLALAADQRAARARAIAAELERRIAPGSAALVSAYWPIRGEPDLRPWMHAACERGLRIALPVALALRQPLQFREWRPGAALARGLWNIPYPADGAEVTPDVLLAPLVGFDAAHYRLGYGGGFFDRTLARLGAAARVFGVGYREAAIPTIYPQPHDIAMHAIVAA